MTASETPTYQWTCMTENAAFAVRGGAGALVFNDRMWLLGGWNVSDKVSFLYVCNSEVWFSTLGRVGTPRVLVYKNALWIAAGNNMTPEVWKLTSL